MPVKMIRYHHPLRPTSCSLRTITANEGMNIARLYKPPKTPKEPSIEDIPNAISTRVNTMETREENNVKYQYSERLARPLKSA